MTKMEEPAKAALDGVLHRAGAASAPTEAEEGRRAHPRRSRRSSPPRASSPSSAGSPRSSSCPAPEDLKDKIVTLPIRHDESGMILVVAGLARAARRPDLARPAGDDDDLLHGLPRRRPGARQPLGVLPGLGVRRGGALPPRAALRHEVPADVARACSSPACSSASSASCRSR